LRSEVLSNGIVKVSSNRKRAANRIVKVRANAELRSGILLTLRSSNAVLRGWRYFIARRT